MPTGYPKRYPPKLDSEEEYKEMADKLRKMADQQDFYDLIKFTLSINVPRSYANDWAHQSPVFLEAWEYAKGKIWLRCMEGGITNKLNERMCKSQMWNNGDKQMREDFKAFNKAEACKSDDDTREIAKEIGKQIADAITTRTEDQCK